MSRPATTRLKINAPTGTPPTLEWIVPGDLSIDDSYQRSLATENAQALIRRIAMFWDWSLCQPINVARRGDGALKVVDGQYRHAAALLRGDIKALPCVIADYPDRAAEAAAFVALNKERRPLNSVDVWRAQLAAGDELAKQVADLIISAGLTVARHSNYVAWKPRTIYCVPGIIKAYRAHGRHVTSAALVALAEAFDGKVLRYAGQLLRALVRFYVISLQDDGFDPDAFLERLALNSQEQWMRAAAERMARQGGTQMAALTGCFIHATQQQAA
jgi:hypothetical protein